MNAYRRAGMIVDLNDRALQQHAAFRHVKLLRHAGQKTPDNRIDFTTYHAFVRAGKAGVAEKSGATREDYFVRSLHVCVGANDRADLTVEHPRESHFLGRRLSVEIDENELRSLPQAFHLSEHAGEWILQRRHKRPALQIDDGHRRQARTQEKDAAPARCGWGIVQGTHKPALVLEQFDHLFLVPKMIATGHDINAGGENFFGRSCGDTRAASGIFTVGHNKVNFILEPKPGDEFPDRVPARLPHDVGDEEKFHGTTLMRRRKRASCFAPHDGTPPIHIADVFMTSLRLRIKPAKLAL